MKKILIFFIAILGFTSCEDLTGINDNPKRSAVAPAGSLFASAQKNLVDNMTTPDVNTNIFRLLAQQWTETTYTDEANYDLTTRNIPQEWWHVFYRDVIQDLREARKIVEADESLDPVVQANQLAMIEILEVYAWQILVDTFGDVPYTDAFKVTASSEDVLLPSYDDAETIYSDLLTRLNTALGDLDNSADSWGENDLLYGGNVDLWIKLGNSVKLKIGMTLADVNPSVAKTAVESAAPGVFTSNADNPILYYKSAPPNTNPIWEDQVFPGRKDFVGADTFVNTLLAYKNDGISSVNVFQNSYVGAVPGTYTNVTASSTDGSGTGAEFTVVITVTATIGSITVTTPGSGYEGYDQIILDGSSFGGTGDVTVRPVLILQQDPRTPFYFTEDAAGASDPDLISYTGEFGSNNSYATYSKGSEDIYSADFKAPLMDYAEVSFFLAEAIDRGFSWSGSSDVETYYNNGITASMDYWGVKSADQTNYLALPEVAYATATVLQGGNRKAIAMQKWLALYNRGFEAWTEWRRLDYPVLVAPAEAFSDVPLRYPYPVSEQNLNTNNYDAAVAKMGGLDDVAVTIFWDIN